MTGGGFSFHDVSVVVEDGTAILDTVTIDLPADGLTAIAGPSGSGKSTLLRCCNRLEVPTAGCIRLDGQDIASLDPMKLRRRAGMVFQRPVVFGGTVHDNFRVALPAVTEVRSTEVLGLVGLPATLLGRQADDLSGGEAQRMCIARALLTDPEILLMDEATSALDVDARKTIETLAADLAASGITIMWVTHDLEQAERIADHVVVILAGAVVPPAQAQRLIAQRSFTSLATVTDDEGKQT